jgi:DNA invertase Pin-like site-specific DNA recombinase
VSLDAIETDAFTESMQFVRRLSRMLAAAAAHVDAEFVREGSQAALEGADNAGGDAGRMPVHAHDRSERLEPERMRQPLQEFVAAVMVHDRLRDNGAEGRHASRQPWRDPSAMEG